MEVVEMIGVLQREEFGAVEALQSLRHVLEKFWVFLSFSFRPAEHDGCLRRVQCERKRLLLSNVGHKPRQRPVESLTVPPLYSPLCVAYFYDLMLQFIKSRTVMQRQYQRLLKHSSVNARRLKLGKFLYNRISTLYVYLNQLRFACGILNTS